MKNIRNAGAKPKYKADVQTKKIHRTIPVQCETDVLKAIEKIVESYKF